MRARRHNRGRGLSPLRCLPIPHALPTSVFGTEGWGFESLRAYSRCRNDLRRGDIGVASLQRALGEQPSLEFRDGAYYDGDDGPFCSTCYDSEGKRLRMVPMAKAFAAIASFKCNHCEGHIA